MARHRSLSFQRFVGSLSPPLLDHYLFRFPITDERLLWFPMNTPVLEEFLSDSLNEDACSQITEEAQLVNDVCVNAAALVLRAY
jgi:hypothetical protein